MGDYGIVGFWPLCQNEVLLVGSQDGGRICRGGGGSDGEERFAWFGCNPGEDQVRSWMITDPGCQGTFVLQSLGCSTLRLGKGG